MEYKSNYITLCSPDFLTDVEQTEKSVQQAQLGVPHSRIQVELGLILQAGTCQILNFI